jgi:hypothetical protein
VGGDEHEDEDEDEDEEDDFAAADRGSSARCARMREDTIRA